MHIYVYIYIYIYIFGTQRPQRLEMFKYCVLSIDFSWESCVLCIKHEELRIWCFAKRWSREVSAPPTMLGSLWLSVLWGGGGGVRGLLLLNPPPNSFESIYLDTKCPMQRHPVCIYVSNCFFFSSPLVGRALDSSHCVFCFLIKVVFWFIYHLRIFQIIYIYMHIYRYTDIYIHIYIISMYIYIYIYVYIYICMYIY